MASSESNSPERQPHAAVWLGAVVFALCFPTVLTFTYFVWLADRSSGMQQSVYTIGKIVQFAFPAVWVYLVLRRQPHSPRPDRGGIRVGLAFGGVGVVAMVGVYLGWLHPAGA